MKKITLNRLELVNFKGIARLTVEPGSMTTIAGANGTGKTTVFDAFTWLLFGKDSRDRKVFSVKTLGGDGAAIARLPHEVGATLTVADGATVETIGLTRRYVEKWTKKRGSATEEFTGHTVERVYNGVPVTEGEWLGKVAAICDEDVFRLITDPLHFAAMKPDAQRAMLFRMAGSPDDAAVAATDPEFGALLARLTGKTLEERRREVAAAKRRLKEDIAAVPQRIDERRRDMRPVADDRAALEKERAVAEAAFNAAHNRCASAEAAEKDAQQARVQRQREIGALEAQREQRRQAIEREAMRDHDEQLARREAMRREAARKDLEVYDLRREAERNLAEVERCKQERERLVTQWKAIVDEKLQPADGDFTCPTCGRRLEPDQVERRMAEMADAFNRNRAERIRENNERGKANKARMEELLHRNAAIMGRVTELGNEVAALKAGASGDGPAKPDTRAAVEADPQWVELGRRIEELRRQAEADPDRTAEAYKAEAHEATARLMGINERLAALDQHDRDEKRVRELEEQLRAMSQELADLEKEEFVMQRFSKARAEAVEAAVNGLFEFTRFKLFDRQINGGETETCVATVGGVPYPDLNRAMTINAGLDIIRAISRHAGVAAPIFIDNAEAVNALLEMDTQVIRLVVSNDKKLKITTDNSKN